MNPLIPSDTKDRIIEMLTRDMLMSGCTLTVGELEDNALNALNETYHTLLADDAKWVCHTCRLIVQLNY